VYGSDSASTGLLTGLMSAFEFDYTVWVFTSTLGVFQFVAVSSNLWGLVVFRQRPSLTKALSVVLVLGSFIWFFASGNRNVPDTADGIDGVVQARWFAIGAAAAIALLTAIASAVNHSWGANHGWGTYDRWPPSGLTWLERTTFARAIAARIAALRTRRS
jgi:predicted acyltransferase